MIFKIELSEQELNAIGAALGGQPYNQVAPLIAKITAQMGEQLKPEPEADHGDMAA